MRISAASRIHIGLIDLSAEGPRRFGGLGAMLKWPRTIIEGEAARTFNLNGNNLLDADDYSNVLERMEIIQKEVGPITASFKIVCRPPAHAGFGSKTSLILGLIVMSNHLCDWGLSREQMMLLSGRGGTSGIGVNGFFTGGLLVDGGHRKVMPASFRPSRYTSTASIPPILVKSSLPSSWKVFLFLPPDGMRYSGAEEDIFFTEHTPIPRTECLHALSSVFQTIIPAIQERSIEQLDTGLQALNAAGFKRREIEGQSETVKMLLNKLYQLKGIAAGMSSFGPVIFAIMDDQDKSARQNIVSFVHNEKFGFLGETWVEHDGFEWN